MKVNKLIAEFWGMELGDDKTMYYDDSENLHPPTPINELKFHSSWDWLMPVVHKCRLESRCEYDEDDNWNEIHWSLEECNLDKTYKAVVQFINEFNKN
jgi:hypothetical protein